MRNVEHVQNSNTKLKERGFYDSYMGRQKSKAVSTIPSTHAFLVVVIVVVHVHVAMRTIEMEIAILPIQINKEGSHGRCRNRASMW